MAVFRMPYIPAMQAAELTDPDAGGIQKSDLSFVLDIRNGIDDGIDLFPCRDSRKELVKVKERDFAFIPVPVQHVVIEIPQLGDMDVDGTGIQFPDILKPADI